MYVIDAFFDDAGEARTDIVPELSFVQIVLTVDRTLLTESLLQIREVASTFTEEFCSRKSSPGICSAPSSSATGYVICVLGVSPATRKALLVRCWDARMLGETRDGALV